MTRTYCDRCGQDCTEEPPGRLEFYRTPNRGERFGKEGRWIICRACLDAVRAFMQPGRRKPQIGSDPVRRPPLGPPLSRPVPAWVVFLILLVASCIPAALGLVFG